MYFETKMSVYDETLDKSHKKMLDEYLSKYDSRYLCNKLFGLHTDGKRLYVIPQEKGKWPVYLVDDPKHLTGFFSRKKRVMVDEIDSPYESIKNQNLLRYYTKKIDRDLLVIAQSILPEDEFEEFFSSKFDYDSKIHSEDVFLKSDYYGVAVEFLGQDDADRMFRDALEYLYENNGGRNLLNSYNSWFSDAVYKHLGKDVLEGRVISAYEDKSGIDGDPSSAMNALDSLEHIIRKYLSDGKCLELAKKTVLEYFSKKPTAMLCPHNPDYIEYFERYVDEEVRDEMIKDAIYSMHDNLKYELVTNPYFNMLVKKHASPDEYDKWVHDSVMELFAEHADHLLFGDGCIAPKVFTACVNESLDVEDERKPLMRDLVIKTYPKHKDELFRGANNRYANAFRDYLDESEQNVYWSSLLDKYYPEMSHTMALDPDSYFSHLVKRYKGEDRWRELGRTAVASLCKENPYSIDRWNKSSFESAISEYFSDSSENRSSGIFLLSYIICRNGFCMDDFNLGELFRASSSTPASPSRRLSQ